MTPLAYRNDRDIARRHLLKHLQSFELISCILQFFYAGGVGE